MSTMVIEGRGLRWWRPGAAGGDREVLGGVDLAVDAGEFVCLEGPSGAGKTVLGSLLLRLRPLTPGGRVHWAGEDVSRLPAMALRPLRPAFQALLQHTGALLPPYLTVAEALAETARYVQSGGTPGDVADLCDALSLAHLLHRHPRHLSGGEQRRASLARVLLARPRFAFVDEAEAGLDPLSQREVLDLLQQRVRRDGLAVLLVSHHPGTVRRYADRALHLEGGQLRAA
jgi:ABC-type multidrug transport system ATPase subunit